MEFFRISRDIPFMRHALVFNVISIITFLAAVVFLAIYGLNLGVDFRGGTVIEVTYGHPVDFGHVRAAIDKLNLGEFSAQSFGSSDTALIRLPLKEGISSAQLSERVMPVDRAARVRGLSLRQHPVGQGQPVADRRRHRRRLTHSRGHDVSPGTACVESAAARGAGVTTLASRRVSLRRSVVAALQRRRTRTRFRSRGSPVLRREEVVVRGIRYVGDRAGRRFRAA